jgi:hypothetical protein
MPAGPRNRVVSLRVAQNPGRRARIGDVVAKRTRGEAARLLLEQPGSPDDPREVAAILADRWAVQLDPPTGPSGTWTMTLGL